MKKILLLHILALLSTITYAQESGKSKDTTTFKGHIYNQKYNVYIQMNFYQNNVRVPFQEIYGDLPGYFGDKQDGRKWLFTNATIKNNKTAEIQIINDYGSEDLTAILTQVNDSTFRLKQTKGSNMKIARNRKWVKLPNELNFIRK